VSSFTVADFSTSVDERIEKYAARLVKGQARRATYLWSDARVQERHVTTLGCGARCGTEGAPAAPE
jgi:hypothetical protein